MFLSYYGLREQPFGVTPDPRFLYFGEVHREALASLVYGIEAGLGFASLIAEPGTGKTTLLYYLLARYRATARSAFIFESQCTSQELLRHLLLEFEICETPVDTLEALNRLKEFLAQQARARRRVIVVLDEAQNFDDSVLETIRLLSNFETAGSKLLHIILSGQPQLAEKLSRPQLLNVRQRIAIASRLRPFAPTDVVKYVAHRLTLAGYHGPALFTPAALEAIARLSGGVPREINRLCFSAMSMGCALKRQMIDADLLREVATDFDFSALLNTETASKALDIPSIEDLGREFADALAREQKAVAAAQTAQDAAAAATPATTALPKVAAAAVPAVNTMPAARQAGPRKPAAQASRQEEQRPKVTARTVTPAPVTATATVESMPLQSWIVSDTNRSRVGRMRSALIAGALALLALAAMGMQFLPVATTPQPTPTSTSEAAQETTESRPVRGQAAPHRSNRVSSASTRRIEP
jgi:general secretion pathway protein A